MQFNAIFYYGNVKTPYCLAAVDPQADGWVLVDRAEVVYRHLCVDWVLWLNCHAILKTFLHLTIHKAESKNIQSGLATSYHFIIISVELIMYNLRQLFISFFSAC